MQLLFIALLLGIASLLIWYSGMRRMIIFIIGISFIPYFISIPSPLISAVLRVNTFIVQLRKLPCIWVLLLVLFSYLMTAIMDQRLGTKDAGWKAIMAFVDTYLMIAVGYFSLYSNRQLRPLNNVLIVLSIILSVYGLLSGVIGKDFYGQIIGRIFGAESDFTPLRSLSRTRLTSFLRTSMASFRPHFSRLFLS